MRLYKECVEFFGSFQRGVGGLSVRPLADNLRQQYRLYSSRSNQPLQLIQQIPCDERAGGASFRRCPVAGGAVHVHAHRSRRDQACGVSEPMGRSGFLIIS